MMKAVAHTAYGPPEKLQLREVEMPVPRENEVLIKIRATTVTTSDCNMRNVTFVPRPLRLPVRMQFGLLKPKNPRLGMDLAGEVLAIGKDVGRFSPGDHVFGTAEPDLGAHAQYICLPEERALAIKPANASWEESAALVTAGITALYYLKHLGNVRVGNEVLINGASGGIGTFAVQLAKHFGAKVTAVCSGANLDLVRSLGADHVLDYSRQDFTKTGRTYDIVFDVAGKSSFRHCKQSLNSGGVYMDTLPKLSSLVRAGKDPGEGGKTVKMEGAVPTVERLELLGALLAEGKLQVVIDKRYPLKHIAEAFRYVEQRRKRGSVVITVTH